MCFRYVCIITKNKKNVNRKTQKNRTNVLIVGKEEIGYNKKGEKWMESWGGRDSYFLLGLKMNMHPGKAQKNQGLRGKSTPDPVKKCVNV